MRTREELKVEIERKGVQQSHLLEILLDIRDLLSDDKKKK